MTGSDRMRSRAYAAAALAGLGLAAAGPAAHTEDLYNHSAFSSLATDRRAERTGDSLTVIVQETTTASNAVRSATSKTGGLGGQFGGANIKQQSLQLSLNSGFDGSGQTSRSGKIVAQLSVVVDEVLPNGDLRVSGDQNLNVNGERTRVHLAGRVRVADISNANTVLSSNLAEAVIDYDGKGFIAKSAKPGLVSRIFSWLGLL